MPVELVKNPIKAFRIIGEETSSIVVEEDINVPDVSPDVYKILYPSARVIIKSAETASDKIIVDGQVLMDILYAADVEGRPLSSLNISADFSHAMEMAGAKPRMKEWIDVVIQHVECHMINSRKISIRVILDIICMVKDIYDIEIPLDVRGSDNTQVLKEALDIKEIIGLKKDKYNIREEIELEADKPSIGEILKTDFRASIKDNQTMEGKVQVNGNLAYNILYKADGDETIENYGGEIPFSEYIEIPEAEADMESTAYVKMRESFVEVSENPEGERRSITINASIDIVGETFKDSKPDALADLYSPKWDMQIERKGYEIDEYLGRGVNSTIIKESINIKHGSPEVEKLCYLDAKPIINEIKVMDDKVGIEGALEANVLYKSSFSGEPMNCITDQFPFKIILDVPGAKTQMYPKANCWIENIAYSAVGTNIIDIRIVLMATADIYKKVSKKVIANVEEKEGIALDYNSLPTATLYVVSCGDTLWKIAKKYNTTVDALAKLNNIEDPEKINVGDKIFILKNMRYGK